MELVVEVPEKPKRFAATPPAKAFENYLKECEQKTETMSSLVASLEQSFKEEKKTGPQQTLLWAIHGKEAIYKKIREMLVEAQDSVKIVTGEKGSISLYKEFHRLLDGLKERSIKVRLITSSADINKYVLEQLRHVVEITYENIVSPSLFVFADNRRLLLATMKPDHGSVNFEPDVAVFSDSAILEAVVQSFLHRWMSASLQSTPQHLDESLEEVDKLEEKPPLIIDDWIMSEE